MRKRKIYTKEFKESAMDLYHRNSVEKSAKDIADGLGISPENLRRWLRESEEAEAKGIKAFPGQGIPRDEEITKLRKKVAEQEEIIEILKKATAIFTAKKTL
jgi:transposase